MVRGWRIFPYDSKAAPEQPFSTRSVADRRWQGGGRFDLPDLSSTLYLAESPEHGYAEQLQDFRNQILTRAHLTRNGLPLAHVSVDVPRPLFDTLPDLADPETLRRYEIRADVLASPRPHRRRTQEIARRLWNDGHAGLRWWSAFHGAWHTTVLFIERAPLTSLTFGAPTVATLQNLAVLSGALAAGLRLRLAQRRALQRATES